MKGFLDKTRSAEHISPAAVEQPTQVAAAEEPVIPSPQSPPNDDFGGHEEHYSPPAEELTPPPAADPRNFQEGKQSVEEQSTQPPAQEDGPAIAKPDQKLLNDPALREHMMMAVGMVPIESAPIKVADTAEAWTPKCARMECGNADKADSCTERCGCVWENGDCGLKNCADVMCSTALSSATCTERCNCAWDREKSACAVSVLPEQDFCVSGHQCETAIAPITCEERCNCLWDNGRTVRGHQFCQDYALLRRLAASDTVLATRRAAVAVTPDPSPSAAPKDPAWNHKLACVTGQPCYLAMTADSCAGRCGCHWDELEDGCYD